MTKILFTAAALILAGQFASAEALKLTFQSAKSPQDVFSAKGGNQAGFTYSYMPYTDWLTKQSGKNFPMEIAPVLTGKVSGGVNMPVPEVIDPSKLKGQQVQEFAQFVNIRNKGGRAELVAKPGQEAVGTPQKQLELMQKKTYVVQTVISGVVDRPLDQLGLSTEKLASMVEAIDADHSHFPIAGSFAMAALEKDHVAGRLINPKQAYLLSVFDFRDYGCPALKNGIRDHFSKYPEKQRLMNESIYVISDLQMNQPGDIDQAAAFFGKRPDAVLTQTVLFADHLIRGAKTIFVFFREGDKTRIVLLANIATNSEYFTGVTGALTRQILLDGPNGAFGGAGGKVLAATGAASDLLAGANQDVNEKNTCDRGLGLGLIKYSQSLFTQFEGYLNKK
jgi:hypothetical protein